MSTRRNKPPSSLAAINIANLQAHHIKKEHIHRKTYNKNHSEKLKPKWMRDVNSYLTQMLLYLLGIINPYSRNDPEIILIKSMINVYIIENNFEGLHELYKVQNRGTLSTKEELLAHRIRLKI